MITTAHSRAGVRAVEACVACGGRSLEPFLDLGRQPLANNLVAPGAGPEADESFPLGVQFCPQCLLVHLTHIVDPERMFSTYRYVPSISTTWLDHCEELAEAVCTAAGLGPGDFVVELGSNDGTLLRAFQRRGQRVLGIDPAANIAAQANANGVPTLNRFFGAQVAQEVVTQYGRPRAVVSTNVLAHVPDPLDLLSGVRHLLAADGVYVNESPSLAELIANNEFDTIYHEHVSYLSLEALRGLLGRAGLCLVDAAPQAVHGGTLRVFCVQPTSPRQPSRRLTDLLRAELTTGVSDLARLRAFAERVAAMRNQLRARVLGLRAEGRRVAAYGATAKGNTLLGYCGLTRAEIEYIADRNPLKQGLLTPGLHIPIVPVEWIAADPPDVLLLLAWNLADEIRHQLDWFASAGGQFLIPVPQADLV